MQLAFIEAEWTEQAMRKVDKNMTKKVWESLRWIAAECLLSVAVLSNVKPAVSRGKTQRLPVMIAVTCHLGESGVHRDGELQVIDPRWLLVPL